MSKFIFLAENKTKIEKITGILASWFPSLKFVGPLCHHQNMHFHSFQSVPQLLQTTTKCNWFQKEFQLSSAALRPQKYFTQFADEETGREKLTDLPRSPIGSTL